MSHVMKSGRRPAVKTCAIEKQPRGTMRSRGHQRWPVRNGHARPVMAIAAAVAVKHLSVCRLSMEGEQLLELVVAQLGGACLLWKRCRHLVEVVHLPIGLTEEQSLDRAAVGARLLLGRRERQKVLGHLRGRGGRGGGGIGCERERQKVLGRPVGREKIARMRMSAVPGTGSSVPGISGFGAVFRAPGRTARPGRAGARRGRC